jgi:hypothetical protein
MYKQTITQLLAKAEQWSRRIRMRKTLTKLLLTHPRGEGNNGGMGKASTSSLLITPKKRG